MGLLDADVYGPSIPMMMRLAGPPAARAHTTNTRSRRAARAQQAHDPAHRIRHQVVREPCARGRDVRSMSMGFLLGADDAVVWRGLMVMSAIERLLRHVAWGPLDVLVIDMPPGTGDTQLSISQNIPITGATLLHSARSVNTRQARSLCRPRRTLRFSMPSGACVPAVRCLTAAGA